MVPQRLSKGPDDWRTPHVVVAAAELALGGRIMLDPFSDADNPTRAVAFWTGSGCTDDAVRSDPGHDGFSNPWEDATWCNPPFSRFSEALEKASYEAMDGFRIGFHCSVSRTETNRFHDHLINHSKLTCVVVHRGKLRYSEGSKGAMLASWTWFFNTDAVVVAKCFARLGSVLRPL